MTDTVTKLAMLLTSAAMLTPGVLAQGFYVDGGYTALSYEGEIEEVEADLDFGAVHLHAGYDFNSYIGIESEFLYGVNDEDVTLFDEDIGDIDASVGLNYLVGVYGRAIWPVSDSFDLFARAGWVQAELDADATATVEGVTESASISESDSGYAIGIGASWDMTDRFYLRADYTRYTIDESDTDGVLIGAGFKF